MINEEFKIWKKTVPLLYETIYTHVLEWPSLCVEWSPATPVVSGNTVTASFLIGTHTSGNAEDFLKICSIELPKTLYDTSLSVPVPTEPSAKSKVHVVAQFPHPGEVNKACYNKSGTKIATLTNTGSVLIFDVTANKLQTELKFHTKEGFGLCWNPNDENQLLSGTEDATIAFWDLSKDLQSPVKTFKSHSAVINSIAWNKQYPSLFASVSDDRTVQIHDLRSTDDKPIISIENAHGNFDINAVAFNPQFGNLLITGGSDNLINCYDLKNLAEEPKPFRKLYGHNSSVSQLEFNPINPNLLLSTGLDRRLLIWDFIKLENGDVNEQEFTKNPSYNDPMLVFIHGGFTSNISEGRWSPLFEDVIIGCAEDSLLEIFKPYLIEEEEDDEEEEENDEHMEDSKAAVADGE